MKQLPPLINHDTLQAVSNAVINSAKQNISLYREVIKAMFNNYHAGIYSIMRREFPNDLDEKVNEALEFISKHELEKLENSLPTDEINEDDWMILSALVESYVDIHPLFLTKERAKIITDAMKAHEAGTYTLSIPILLAQIEGIVTKLLVEGKIIEKCLKKEGGKEEVYKIVSETTKCKGEKVTGMSKKENYFIVMATSSPNLLLL